MGQEFYKIIEIFFKGDPVLSGVTFLVIAYILLLDKELRGWVSRLEATGCKEEKERKDGDKRIYEILELKQVTENDFKNRLIIELIGKFKKK